MWRVVAGFRTAKVDPPPESKIVAMISNFGGFDRIDQLMPLIHRLGAAGELSEKRLFGAIATATTYAPGGRKDPGRRTGSRAAKPRAAKAAPRPTADAPNRRREQLRRIDEDSRRAD